MKGKILVSIICSVCLLIASSVAFAQKQGPQADQQNQQMIQNEYKEQISEKVNQILQYNLEIADLSYEIRDLSCKIKEKLKYLQENPQESAHDDLASYQESLHLIRLQRMGLGLTIGHIRNNTATMNRYWHNRYYEPTLFNLERVREVQEERIMLLEGLIENLNALFTCLSK